MQWLRKWLTNRTGRSARISPTSSNGFRPRVESLDDRIVPTLSTAITNLGTFTTAVDINNNLVAINPMSGVPSQTGITNVRTAQIFRDANGGLGADVIFLDGSWQHIDSGPLGGFTISANQAKSQFGGLILDAGTAYDSMGRIRLDILVSSTTTVDTNGHLFANAQGHVMEFNQAFGGGLVNLGLGDNILWVSAYNAIDGGTGIAFAQITPGGGTAPSSATVRTFDFATGLHTLYNGVLLSSGTIAEFSQTTSVPKVTSPFAPAAPPQIIIDLTYEGSPTAGGMMGQPLNDGGYAIQFSSGMAGTSVNGIISQDNTIKTGILYPGAQYTP